MTKLSNKIYQKIHNLNRDVKDKLRRRGFISPILQSDGSIVVGQYKIKKNQNNFFDIEDKNQIILTNNSWFVANEKQFIFIITQSINELKKIIMEKKNHPNKYFGNFYYTQQNLREIPSIYLHTKYLMDVKNILLRLNMKNPTLTLILFISIALFFPENHYFYENEFLSNFTNMDEKKLIKYLIRRKFFKIIKNSNN
jgi:hypothetical protein